MLLMNRLIPPLLVFVLVIMPCGNNGNNAPEWISSGIETASHQLKITAETIEGAGRFPQSICVGRSMEKLCIQLGTDSTAFTRNVKPEPQRENLGKLVTCDIYDWTSGFFPGSLWELYELTGDLDAKEEAIRFTNMLNPLRHYDKTHDIGFMVECSYGNALKLSPSDTIKSVIIEAAENLIGRFDPKIGCIRSWDFGPWNFPVIIDNMMNLELLFNATDLSGDNKYRNVAISHANTTMKNHFREDHSSYHVVSYNSDGTVESKGTYQGKDDGSSWARGQAWGAYGYTMCFRETGDSTYLDIAEKIADMIMENVKTEDAIPYWDYDAPALPSTPRDASAAAVTASALLELSTFADNGKKYFDYAEKILTSLSSDAYLAKEGENEGFILMHSVGSLPHGSQIDTPLNYADYYYLEALKRYLDLI